MISTAGWRHTTRGCPLGGCFLLSIFAAGVHDRRGLMAYTFQKVSRTSGCLSGGVNEKQGNSSCVILGLCSGVALSRLQWSARLTGVENRKQGGVVFEVEG